MLPAAYAGGFKPNFRSNATVNGTTFFTPPTMVAGTFFDCLFPGPVTTTCPSGGSQPFGPLPTPPGIARNSFRGPGAWDFDLAASKSFKITERVGLEFRAEAFNLFNHHDMFVNGFAEDAAAFSGGPVLVEGKKGGLGALATGGEHDERRFGQFALRLTF